MLRQVEGMVEARLAGEFRFKGKSGLQRAYQLVPVRDHATRFDAAVARGLTSYVGRSSELAVLQAQRQNLNAIRVVDVVGDPGIGKSRLLHEFASQPGANQLTILRGDCSADGQGTPFLPFIEIMRQWFTLSSGEPDAIILLKLEDRLKRIGCWSPFNRALLLNLLGLQTIRGGSRRQRRPRSQN